MPSPNAHVRAPEWLTGKLAKSYFYLRLKELPAMDYCQRELLAKAAAEHESYISCQLELEQYQDEHHSIFLPGSAGNLVPHPATKLQQAHGEALRKWEAQLRITLKNDEAATATTNEELDEILNGGDE